MIFLARLQMKTNDIKTINKIVFHFSECLVFGVSVCKVNQPKLFSHFILQFFRCCCCLKVT